MFTAKLGALAQLGERLHGMQEVRGSIPLGSTIFLNIFRNILNALTSNPLPLLDLVTD